MVLLTQGGEGATATVRAGFPSDPLRWPGWRPRKRRRWPAPPPSRPPAGRLAGDPTGAGDVWGATFFSSLLAGMPVVDAIRRAHRFAGAKMGVRGATDLYPAPAHSTAADEPPRAEARG